MKSIYFDTNNKEFPVVIEFENEEVNFSIRLSAGEIHESHYWLEEQGL